LFGHSQSAAVSKFLCKFKKKYITTHDIDYRQVNKVLKKLPTIHCGERQLGIITIPHLNVQQRAKGGKTTSTSTSD